MTSNNSFENLSLCIYIGNTSSIDDQLLINYCSQYGKIISYIHENRLFCDFHLIEFSTKQEFDIFLNISIHKIGSNILDVKIYKKLFNNSQLLNIDRKIYLGPILNSNSINTIVQFYKIIDPTLQYCLSQQNNQTYLLLEFNNREYTRTIIRQQTIPKMFDNQLFTIHLPLHPKELITKYISTKNNQYQIYVHGLNENITENILIDYFNKQATVIGCQIISTNPKYAIIEFENEKILDTSTIHLNGTNLSLSRPVTSPVHSSPIHDPSPDICECGWTSPPRTVIKHHPTVTQSSEHLPLKPMNINTNVRTIEMDVKPAKNILHFVEQFQNEIDQIKDEYKMKFAKDRTSIEHAINRLINDQQTAFDKLDRYLKQTKRKYR